MRYNPNTQKLFDIEDAGENNWLRIYCKNREVFEALPDCLTYTTIGDDEDVDAMRFIRRDGTGYAVAGVSIDRFEVLEETKMNCPCCGKTLVGEYDICDVCSWENDPIQLNNPDFQGGANQMSLNEAKRAYREGRKVR